MLREIILAVIVSIDTYLAAAAYQGNGIKIPLSSAAVICMVSSAFLGGSLVFAEHAKDLIPDKISVILEFIVLLSVGIITIFKSFIRNLVRKLEKSGELSLHTKESGIVVKLYLDDTAADLNNSKRLSPREAMIIAFIASIDCISVGLAMGGNGVNPVISAFFTFIAGFFAIFLGELTGRKISAMQRDFAWIGGLALIIFGVFSL